MLTHRLLTWIVNAAVYVGVLAFIITFLSGVLGFKNPLGGIAKIIGRLLKTFGKWFFELLGDVLQVLFRWLLRIVELLFEFIVRMFQALGEIIRERKYKG
ncbi:hypothetical protein [Tenacibaculum halocynthiae]|uniref:hypothetical protein n=1 Tax=Tenacibaculum halocynthiae TaxID=1254437 RepID=UPI003D64A889